MHAAEDDFEPPDRTLDLPRAALEAYLGSQAMTLDRGCTPRQFAGGLGNVNYLVEVDGAPMVLRRPPRGPLPLGANDMAREFRVLSGLWQRFPLAPRALHLCEDAEVIGAPFFLMEYRPGLVVRGSLPESMHGREDDIGQMLVHTLAALHRVDPTEVGLGDFGRPEGFLARTVEGWIKRAEVASDSTPPAAVFDLGDWLHDNLVGDGEPTLIHNNFKLDNLILDPADPVQPIAVIDWDMCTRGDPLFDLATLLSYWTESGDPPVMHELAQMPTAARGFMSRETAANAYAELTGCDLSDFVFYRVLAMFKLGVVFLQLHARHRRGATRDPRYAGFRKLAEGLLDFTLDVAAAKVF